MNAMAHVRGERSECAEYWRREVDRLQTTVSLLRDKVQELRAPRTIVYRGFANGVLEQRSIILIPEEGWAAEVERFPYLESWEWAAVGDLMFLFGPTITTPASGVAAECGPVSGND